MGNYKNSTIKMLIGNSLVHRRYNKTNKYFRVLSYFPNNFES